MGLVLICLVVAALLVLLVSLGAFLVTFYAPRRKNLAADEYSIPPGKVYEPHRDTMVSWMKETRALPHEVFSIRSHDGLKLCGKYYEFAPGAPIELMFHGYRGSADRDLCGGVQRCFALGHSAFIVDQRTSGNSEGRVITFGIKERWDCVAWTEFMVEHFGPDVRIILCGISMGAATVMMAAGEKLPPNVVGVLADCGYTSARDIIRKVIRQLHLPRCLYPFVKLGARIYGGFDLEETTPSEALKKCRVPVIFFHGDTDDFVPCEMSRMNFEQCAAPKKLVTVPLAGHGLSYLIDRDGYLAALEEFAAVWGLSQAKNV